jgi:hypothetical protein
MSGIGERLREMMPGSTASEKEEIAHETGFHPVSKGVVEQQEGKEVNTLGYNTTAAATTSAAEETCNREFFTKVEDRERVVELHEFIKEHVPIEREFVVETRFVGERELADQRREEVLGVEERIVEETQPKGPCE